MLSRRSFPRAAGHLGGTPPSFLALLPCLLSTHRFGLQTPGLRPAAGFGGGCEAHRGGSCSLEAPEAGSCKPRGAPAGPIFSAAEKGDEILIRPSHRFCGAGSEGLSLLLHLHLHPPYMHHLTYTICRPGSEHCRVWLSPGFQAT